MRRAFLIVLAFLVCSFEFSPRAAFAHDTPFSYLDLRVKSGEISGTVEGMAVDFAHDLPNVDAPMLLSQSGADKYKTELFAILVTRLKVTADGQALMPELLNVSISTEKPDLRFQFRMTCSGLPKRVKVSCRLFPYDPRHKTFFNLYVEDKLKQQTIFEGKIVEQEFLLQNQQSVGSVVRQFFFEGIHHIFIGPDHILFIVGLLFLGGTLPKLLKIVTAFTVAHSITLALATFNVLNPSSRFIEPMIALSIVFVGVYNLVKRGEGKDGRLIFAFCFGFIHGFGFASALREMELPSNALAWSLFSFNAGVEAGQACIVLTVAPLLALLKKHNETASQRVVFAGSLFVIFAGAFWFVQRVFTT